MKHLKFILIVVLFIGDIANGKEFSGFNTQWIPAKPEVLTYNSKDEYSSGLYQIAVSKKDTIFEVYINIVSPGFSKTVSGTFNSKMHPLQSSSKIIVDGQIVMDTKCTYTRDSLNISTLMNPYNKIMANSLDITQPFVDFSQTPLLIRSLPLNTGEQYTFTTINPVTNTLVPLTLKVIGEETVLDVDCYKVEINDFEGRTIYWVDKKASHRALRAVQLKSNRSIELIK